MTLTQENNFYEHSNSYFETFMVLISKSRDRPIVPNRLILADTDTDTD